MAVCSHLDTIQFTELPEPIAGCEECLRMGSSLGASPDVHDVWRHSLLRLVTEPAREPSRGVGRASDRTFRRAGRGLELVLRRRGGVRRSGR